uniref:Kinesin-like protein n=1 Tax=Dendroctonus ponderosae TaxID=77166 RepID=A0AAR5P0J1_DENPD
MAQSLNQPKKTNKTQNILVAVRVRPFTDDERSKNSKNIVNCVSRHELQCKDKKYHFDKVFDFSSSQLDVYQFAVGPMIIDVLAGYNCTVFAYGQTGTGKTHTMVGDDKDLTTKNSWREYEMAGCIPRAAANIFEELRMRNVRDYDVTVSFLELYNEEVRDLFNAEWSCSPLSIFNDTKGAVCIQNLRSVSVVNSSEIFNLLKEGMFKRQTAATLMNNHSSRSHVVFTITVHTREILSNGEEVLKTGKLNLVDLAGSENIAKSGAKDKRAQESANINKSLLTLGRVIQILSEKNSKHIPYRDSKLTRILQDSLGGHTKTCIVATVSPSYASLEETLNTLEYASRARDVKNTPMINEKVTKAQMIKELSSEIDRLKRDLYATRLEHGIFLDPDNWKELNDRLEANSQVVSAHTDTINHLRNKISDLEAIRQFKEQEFDEIMNQCKQKEKLIEKARDCLKVHRISIKQEQYLSKCYADAANETDAKVKELLEITKDYSRCQEVLHQKLETQYLNNMSNEKLIAEKSGSICRESKVACNKFGHFLQDTLALVGRQNYHISSAKNDCESYERRLNTSEHGQALQSILQKHSLLYKEQSLQLASKLTAINDAELHHSIERVQDSVLQHLSDYDDMNTTTFKTVRDTLNTIRGKLKTDRRRKEALLKELQLDILGYDGILKDIEEIDDYYSDQKRLSDDKKSQLVTEFNDVKLGVTTLINASKAHIKSNVEICEKERYKELDNTHKKIREDIELQLTGELSKELAFVQSQKERLHSLQEDTKKFGALIEANASDTNSILLAIEDIGKTMSSQLTKSERVGDTPNKRRFSFTPFRTNGALPRDILINKFQEEYSEHIGNESFTLNLSFEGTDGSNSEEVSIGAESHHTLTPNS